MTASLQCCFAIRQGIQLLAFLYRAPVHYVSGLRRCEMQSGAAPIRVVRVVVVDVARGVHIPLIVSVGNVSTTQPDVLSRLIAYSPCLFLSESRQPFIRSSMFRILSVHVSNCLALIWTKALLISMSVMSISQMSIVSACSLSRSACSSGLRRSFLFATLMLWYMLVARSSMRWNLLPNCGLSVNFLPDKTFALYVLRSSAASNRSHFSSRGLLKSFLVVIFYYFFHPAAGVQPGLMINRYASRGGS